MHLLKKHAVATVFVLAFVLSWYPAVLHATGLVPEASGMNPLGVAAAAIVTAAVTQGWSGTKQLLSRLIRFRAHPGWYAFLFGFPVAACFAAMGAARLFAGAGGAEGYCGWMPHSAMYRRSLSRCCWR